MKRILSLIFFCVLLTLSSGEAVYASQQEKPQKEKLQLFMNGKKYDSVKEYKAERIKAYKASLAAKAPKEAKASDENIIRELSDKELGESSKEDLIKIIKKFYEKRKGTEKKEPEEPGDSSEDIKQMKEMLEEFKSTHQDAPSLELDPSKVKTIIISPKEQAGESSDKTQETIP
jgi:hypothetical protein